jgi:hypothetical protein
VKWERLCALGRVLPEVEEGRWYGTPALLVRGKGLVRLKEDGRSVAFVVEDVEDQEALVEEFPEVFFVTEHYRGHASVLARLGTLRVAQARERLERAWCKKAPASLVRRRAAGGR